MWVTKNISTSFMKSEPITGSDTPPRCEIMPMIVPIAPASMGPMYGITLSTPERKASTSASCRETPPIK